MKTLAPELSALMTIFASAGPVSSTRRSSRSGGADATLHSDSRSSRVSAGNSGRSPAAKRASRSSRAASSARRRGAEAVLEIGDEVERLAVEQLVLAGRPAARRPRRSCRPPPARAVRERLQRRGATRSGAASRASSRTRSAGSCARRRSALGRPVPPYHARSAAVLPYQPGGQTRRPSRALALDRVAADHDVARARARGSGAGHRPSLRSGRRGRSRARRRGRRRRVHRSGRPPRRLRAGASARSTTTQTGRREALDVAVERAPQARRLARVGGHDRVDQQDRAGQLAVDAADLLDPARGRAWDRAPTRGAARSSATVRSRSPARPGPPRTAANRPLRPCQAVRGHADTIGAMRIVQQGERSETYGGRFTGRVELEMLAARRGGRPPRRRARALLRGRGLELAPPSGRAAPAAARGPRALRPAGRRARARRPATSSSRPRASATSTARRAGADCVWLTITWGVTDWEDLAPEPA